MRRFVLLGTGGLLSLIVTTMWLGCGGGGAVANVAVSLTLAPTAVSLNRGATAQITVRALDVNNNPVTVPPLAYHSSSSAITVSNTGLICAGQWDANFVNCYTCSNPDLITNQCPANNSALLPLGMASITATAAQNNVIGTSSTVVVTDHEPIDSVEVCLPTSGSGACQPPPSGCVSQNGTAQFTAQAFSNDAAACARICASNPGTCNIGAPVPCRVPDSTVGAINWLVQPGQVGTVDATLHAATQPVTVTAFAPGKGVVAGSVGVAGSIISGSAPFTTCAVTSIHVHQPDSPTDTSFTAPIGGTVQLVADVFDSNTPPVKLTSTLALTWLTSQPALASVSPSAAQGATVQALAPGTGSITAACLPPSCNDGFTPLQPIYSDNVVTANITGTVDSTVLTTTSTAPANVTASTVIVPIDTTSNTTGSAFILPSNLVVNSMVMTPVGNPAFLGTTCTSGTTTGPNGAACSGLLRFDPTVAVVSAPIPTITGTVLATDGTRVVVSDPSTNQTFIALAAGPAIEATLPLGHATAAAFAIDGSRIYIVDSNQLFMYSPRLPLRPVLGSLSGTPSALSQAVAFFATGAMAYVADSGGQADDVVATCADAINPPPVGVGNSPTLIAAVPNGTAMVDANSPNLDEIDASANFAATNGICPPLITNSVKPPNGFSGIAGFTAKQLLVTPNSQLAIILTSDQGVLVNNLGTKQTSVIALAGGAQPLSGGVTPDSANLYVGASDGKVHRVDLTKTPPTDAQSITVSLCPSVATGCNPDFLVVRPVATVATLTALAVTPVNPIIGVGQTQQFTATGTFSDKTTRDMTNFVSWASSNPVVAVIGPNTAVTPPLTTPGLARALATGSTSISATSAGVTSSTTLTVQ